MSGKPIEEARTFVLLSVVILLVAAVASAENPDAKVAYKAGKRFAKEHRALAAYIAFEKAVDLDPSSARYRRALDEARDPALEEAKQLAPKLANSDFSALLALHVVCQRIRPGDPRTLEVESLLLQTRSRMEKQISQAEAKARAGDLAGARSVLESVGPYRSHFPTYSHAEEEIAFRESLQIALESATLGNFRAGLEAAQKALSLRAGDSEALQVQALVADRLVEKAQPIIAAKTSSGLLSELALAVTLLAEVERSCLPCLGRLGDLDQIRADFEKRILSLLEEIAKTKSRPAEWAACAVSAEAGVILDESKTSVLDKYCPKSANVSGLRIGLSVQAPEGCEAGDWGPLVKSALPPSSIVVPLTAGTHGLSMQQVDLSISIIIDRCSTDFLGDSDVQTQTSIYAAGVQQLSNPEFVQLQSQLRSAQIEQARLQSALRANPNDYGASIASAAIAIRIGTLSRRLRETSPYTESPIEQPYTYEVFKAGTAGILEGTVAFLDPIDAALSTSMPFQVRHEVWEPGVRGVYPNDARGLRSQEPLLPSSDSLHRAALQRLNEQVSKRVSEFLPVWFAAKASVALSTTKPFDTLGYLALLRLVEIPASDPDLQQYRAQHLNTALLSAGELKSQSVPLGVFETRLRRSSESVNAQPNRTSVARQSLEKALRAVVVIRRGGQEGTGFLVSPDGFIVTNHHVIDASGNIVVETSEGEEFLAAVVSQSPEKDLALLHISASKLPYLQLGSEEEARIGDDIYALGNPRGLQGTVTKGIISAKRRLAGVRLIQIDAPINPGNSGGPLLQIDGRVVGVNTLKLQESEGLNFAISIDEAKAVFSSMLPR